MRRSLLLVLLGLGAVAGFAAGFRSLRYGELGFGHRWGAHPAMFDAVAEACVRAAERGRTGQIPPATTP